MDITQNDNHKLIELFYDTKYAPFLHHHNSFNQFMIECVMEEFKNPRLIYENENEGKIYRHLLKYNNVRLKEPMDETSDDINTILFPEDFKLRFLNYSSRLIADVEQIQEIYTPEDNVTVTNIVYSDNNVSIGKIPIMIRSNNCNTVLHKNKPNIECPYNCGGYFLLKGAEKVVIPQESIAFNRCYVFPKKDKTTADKNAYTVQVYSKVVENLNSNLQIVSISLKKDVMMLTMSQLSDIPVCILFKALGIVSDKDIVQHITMANSDADMTNVIKNSLSHYKAETWKFNAEDNEEPKKYIYTQQDALNYMITKIKTNNKRFSTTDKESRYKQSYEYLHKTILERDLLPHMAGNDYNKGCFLGLMCNKLLNYYLGRIDADDRDSMSNKRIDTVGILMGQIFRQALKKLDSDNTNYFKKKNTSDEQPVIVIPQIKHTIIEQNLNNPLTNGTWGVSGKKGVAQMIHRYTYLQFTSVLKRVVTSQISTTSKVTGMRFAHNTQYGFLDIPETPEHGHNVGTVKQLSNIASITINAAAQPGIIKAILEDEIINLSDVSPAFFSVYTKVMINGEWIGVTDTPVALAKMLKGKRISGEIEKNVGIAHNFNTKEININTDAGRMIRPLLRVENNKLVLTKKMISEINIKNKNNPLEIHKWVDFLMKYPETVDMVDPEEQETLMIAYWVKDVEENYKRMNTPIKDPHFFGDPVNRYDSTNYKRYTHCELHPSTNSGNVLSNAIFSEHNDGPRNYFNFAQQKQAMGIYTSNYKHRTDIGYTLYHPQRPLTFPRTAKYTGTLDLPYSQNCMVAICMYSGYNQEDSILMNQSSIDRGLFVAESYRKENMSIAKTTTTQDETFKKPIKGRTTGMKDANYEKLNARGFINEETVIKNNDVLYGKTTPLAQIDDENPEITERCSSMVYRAGVDGTIDKVYTSFKNHEGFLTYNTRIRQQRIPAGGDKFCCYTSDHEVMTDKGWKGISEITMDDKIACVSRYGDLDMLRYEYPLEIQEYDYDGELYKVESNQINLVTTPNHRMYVGNRSGKNYKIELAKDIYGKRRCYKKNIDLFLPDTLMETFTIPGVDELPDLVVPIKPWLLFFGIWIAEGCTVTSSKDLRVATHKQRVKDGMEYAMHMMNIKIGKHKDNGHDDVRNSWRIYDKRFIKFFTPLSVGSINKFLPDWVWKLDMIQCRVLIDGMMLGDGHTMENGTRRYDTSSTKLADDFQRLCLHSGWSCNKLVKAEAGQSKVIKSGPKTGQTITSTTKAYRLTIITAQNHPLVNKNITSTGEKRHDNYVTYDHEDLSECIRNKVYCCTVPFNGIMYMRRKGMVTLSGNSRHGQKGTIGYILKHEDMPYNEQGIRPDIIINACCIPTRRTVGQLLESIMNKYAAIEGRTIQIDQFEHIDMQPVIDRLQQYKTDVINANAQDMTPDEFYKLGSEKMYNGYDGREMDGPVFMNITTYLRLKHLVNDKVHARARGPMTALIRQPPEGRIRDGGLRLGEMERDAYIGHGLSLSLKEKFMESSDKYSMHVCSHCGLIARKKLTKNVYICDACEALKPSDKPLEKPYIHKVSLPYACKIFMQEIMSVNILPRIRTRNDEFTNAI